MRSPDGSTHGQLASDPELNAAINDAAAMLFWTHAAKHGFEATVQEILNTQSACLFQQEGTIEILEPYGIFRLSKEIRDAVVLSICRVVDDSIKREENLVGVVYAEDAATGRSTTAAAVNATAVCMRPARISGHEQLERQGTLCLRHPLPAVVFSEARPGKSFIQVASTRQAFGCEVPMFLAVRGCVEVSPTLFALSGVFHIPVRDRETGDLWSGVIQNSIRSTETIAFRVRDAVHCIEFGWEYSARR